MGHKHTVYDTDAHFSINPVTRVIKNESSKKTTLIQYDHNSERFSFDLPRHIEGHDMMLCNLVEVHYTNKDAATGEENKDFYEVTDMQLSADNDEMIVFSWLIAENATQYAGTLEFSIKFKCMENGVCVYRWNTANNSDISVASGKDNSGEAVEIVANAVDQWREQIFGNAENAVANINLAEQNALEAIRTEGAAQVQAVTDEGTAQVENVKAAAAAIEADREQIHRNNMTKAVAIVGSAEGEVILLDDSAEMPFSGFNVFGKSTQETTTGKNLLPVAETLTFEGYQIVAVSIPAGSYILSVESIEHGGTYQPYVHFVANNVGSYLYSATKESEITLPQDETEVRIYSNNFSASGSSGISATLQRLMLSPDGGEYEPYTGGIPSPNPEFPQEIKSIEEPEVAVYGKNLLNAAEKTTFTGTYGIACDIPPGNYVFSFESETHGGEKHPYFRFYDNKIWLEVKEDEKVVNVTLEKPETKIYLYSNGTSNANSDDVEATINKMMVSVQEGSYEPHKEQQPIPLPYTLHAIPVTSGGNYTDADGQQWICDEVDLVRGVLVQRVKEFVLSELNPETWYTWGVDHTTEGITGFYHYYTEDVLMDFILSNIGVYGNKTWGGLSVGVGASASSKYLTISVYNSVLADVSTNEKAIESLKTMLADTNAKIYAAIEPLETALSESEISAFKAVMTNYPYTTILNDSGANMAVRYGIDTKTYIDKAIAEAIANVNGAE